MRIAALFAVSIAMVAVVLVTRGDSGVRIYILIAVALGIGLSVLLGAALVSFLSCGNIHGQGSSAAHPSWKDKNDNRS